MSTTLTDFEKQLCARLRQSRKEAGLSLYALENLTGISRSTLQRYETGKSTSIKSSTLQILADALNVTPAYLMGWESKNISTEYYANFNAFLSEIGGHISYNNINNNFYLEINDISFPITEEQIRDLKETCLSYLKFKLNELMFNYKPSTTE